MAEAVKKPKLHKDLKIGDMVYWYDNIRDGARPWPAFVLNKNGDDILELNIMQFNALKRRDSVNHRSNPTLGKWHISDVAHMGCWERKEEYYARHPDADDVEASAPAGDDPPTGTVPTDSDKAKTGKQSAKPINVV